MGKTLRGVGDALMTIGAMVGVATTAAIVAHAHPLTIPWMVAVGMAKLGYAASLGLIFAGGGVRRFGVRASRRQLRGL
jgi:hypothetical protein